MKKTLLLTVATAALIMTGCDPKREKHWDYSQNGPTHWGEFSKTCDTGQAQSPINIIPGNTYTLKKGDIIHMDEDVHTTATVIDNGHSIKVTPKNAGTVVFRGAKYKLLQFHFHGKSEHTVDGKRYDMVAHLVHKNLTTGQLLVIAIFFTEGKNNPVLDNIIGNVGESIDIDPKDLIPDVEATFYHYVGSLTTPPCTENVQWYLLKTPNTASAHQIKKFRKFYVDNERPVQELYDRHVEAN